MIPILLINNLFVAVVVNVLRWLVSLSYLSYTIAKSQKRGAWIVIRDHILIAIFVIIVTYFVGKLIHGLIG
jgi:VIT1/CCC1 family predicted Fe2+/Mn2+ transporter